MPEQMYPEDIAAEIAALNAAVDKFAAAMKETLAHMVRAENRTGWADPANAEDYYKKLLAHAAGVRLAAGQEVNIANFAMFLLYQRLRFTPTGGEQLFYLQDSRSYVGNDVLWWVKGGRGYTTDLSKAQTYTKADALAQHEMRKTDIPWPKGYIDGKTRPAVDMQYIKRSEALSAIDAASAKVEARS